MKKLLSLGLLACCAVLATQRPAHAWVNSKFSVGLTWQYQSGNNSLLWGLFRNGQVPTPADYNANNLPVWGPYAGTSASCYAGFGADCYGGGVPSYAAPAPTPALPTALNANQQAWQFGTIPSWYGNNAYQSVGYNADAYANYYSGYYAAPAYWYNGR